MTTTFTPGDAVGVCGPGARLIAGIQLDDPRLPRLWEVLARGDDDAVDRVLAVLLEGGFPDMPAFAVASTSGTTTRVVVRHPAVVEATVDGATVVSSSTPGGTWSDVTIEGASALVLRASDATASTLQLPFHAGMTPAAAVRIVLDEGAASVVAPAAPPATAPADAPAPSTDASAPAAPHLTLGKAEAEDVSRPAADASHAEDVSEATPLTAVWKAEEPQDDADAAAVAVEVPEEPPAAADSEDPAEGPADDPADEASDEPDDSTVMRPVAPPPPPAAPPAAAPAAPGKSGGLIDGVPWLTANWAASSPTPTPPKPTFETPAPPARPAAPVPPAAPASPPAPPAATPASAAPAPGLDEEGDDSVTVLRSELVKEMGSAGIVGASVLAVDCPNGHPTSAHEPTCRLCGAPVPDTQEPRQIPRPALGALVLASGDRLVLDKDAVLGRAPYEPEGSTERPHLLRVGESGDISRQHARIKLDGWHVSVRDLGTANGTTLTLPGGTPQQLRANEDYQLEDGAEIGIADVVTLRYEVKP